jgi:predicted nucleic acid-binding protein
VVDANVFIAAVKPFTKRQRARKAAGSLSLLLRLITDSELELFASRPLLDEYRHLARELSSETSMLILGQLSAKAREVTEIREAEVAICKPYFPEGEAADVLHAAAALQSDAVLISNDKDFDKIRDVGIIEVWSISEAMRELSISK